MQNNGEQADFKEYLKFCDDLRDDVFIGLGVQIEDSSTDVRVTCAVVFAKATVSKTLAQMYV